MLSGRFPAALLVVVTSLSTGCDEKTATQVQSGIAPEPEDAPPVGEDIPSAGPARCQSIPDAQPLIVRGGESGRGSGDGAVEFGSAITWGDAFAVGLLRGGTTSEAQVAVLRGGTLHTVSLGRVHGQAGPPVLSPAADRLLAVVSDNDASSALLRVASVAFSPQSLVTWGAEAQAGRGESDVVALATGEAGQALMVFDRQDVSRGRSRLFGLRLAARTGAAQGREFAISPPGEDADSPMLLSAPTGYWLLWLSYPEGADSPEPAGPREPLIEEYPRRLRVARLDADGKLQGEPLSLTKSPARSLVFDAATRERDGDLVVAFRDLPFGQGDRSLPVRARVVSADGTVEEHRWTHRELGAAAPRILRSGPNSSLLVATHGSGQRVLLAGLDGKIDVEPGLFGTIPLVRSAAGILVARPRGNDVAFELLDCQLKAPEAHQSASGH